MNLGYTKYTFEIRPAIPKAYYYEIDGKKIINETVRPRNEHRECNLLIVKSTTLTGAEVKHPIYGQYQLEGMKKCNDMNEKGMNQCNALNDYKLDPHAAPYPFISLPGNSFRWSIIRNCPDDVGLFQVQNKHVKLPNDENTKYLNADISFKIQKPVYTGPLVLVNKLIFQDKILQQDMMKVSTAVGLYQSNRTGTEVVVSIGESKEVKLKIKLVIDNFVPGAYKTVL